MRKDWKIFFLSAAISAGVTLGLGQLMPAWAACLLAVVASTAVGIAILWIRWNRETR